MRSTALEKLGWHASDTAEISFEDVFVPEENLLGQEDAGFYLIMANFQWERLLMALGAVGGMQVAFEKTLRFALSDVRSDVRSGNIRRSGTSWPRLRSRSKPAGP